MLRLRLLELLGHCATSSGIGKLNRGQLSDLASLVALLVLAGALRLHHYDHIPYPNETADEYAYVWSGWSWLHEGAPTAWSWKAAYGQAPVYLLNQSRYRLVTPWLDHPPLYALLVGGAASLAGAPDLLDAPLSAARLVSVALGALAVPLLYLLARLAYGRLVAMLAGLLFATIPTVVVASRLAVAESLIVVLMLVALLATRRYLTCSSEAGQDREAATTGPRDQRREPLARSAPAGRGRLWLLLATVAAALAVLAKVPGLTVGVSVVLLLASARRWRAALVAGLGALVGLAPYLAYGWVADRAVLRAVLADQAGRATGLGVLSRLLAGGAVPPVTWQDSWMAFLWLALAYATFRRDRLLALATAPYLIFLVAAIEQNELRVWYREPLFPYLCLAGGVFLRDTLVRPDPLRAALLLFGVTFGKLGEALDAWALLSRVPLGPRLYPLLVAALAAPILAAIVWPGRAARRALGLLVAGALAVAIAGSLVMVLRAEDLYPAYRPAVYYELSARTSAGLVLTRYSVEPETAVPGGWLRVSTAWFAERDVADARIAAYVRPFDRHTGSYGSPAQVGQAAALTSRAAEQATVDVSGVLPTDLREGDYEVGVRVGDDRVGIGVVRVRALAAANAIQSVGLRTTFEDVVALHRAALGQPRSTPSGTVYPLLLRVEARRPMVTNYHVFTHVTTADGQLVAQSDGLPGGRRGDSWRVGEVVDDWRDLVLPPATPPGRYYLKAGLYELVSGRRLRTAAGGDAVQLGVIEVGRPLAERDVPSHLGTKLAGGVELVGYDLRSSEPARQLELTLYWRATGAIPRDYTVFVHLVDKRGELRAQADGPPDRGRLPTSTWRPGQIVIDSRELGLTGVPAGQYRLLAGLYQAPDGPRLAVLGRDDGAADVAAVEVR